MNSLNSEAHATGSMMLILDVRGRIQFCSAAAAGEFGRDIRNLLDQPITVLIPAMPIRTQTPGYNIAYVSFWFSEHKWRRFDAIHGEGRRFMIDLALGTLNLDGRRGFVLDVRHPVAAVAARVALPPLGHAAAKRAALIPDRAKSCEMSACAGFSGARSARITLSSAPAIVPVLSASPV